MCVFVLVNQWAILKSVLILWERLVLSNNFFKERVGEFLLLFSPSVELRHMSTTSCQNFCTQRPGEASP